MKIENFIIFLLIMFLILTNEQIGALRITNLNPNNNFLEKNNINFSTKNEALSSNNNLNQNPNLNLPFISDKSQPPTFSRSFIDNTKFRNCKYFYCLSNKSIKFLRKYFKP